MSPAARSAVSAALCFASTPCSADPHLPDTFLARVEALASMETLNASILASRSATKTLEAWCADHNLAMPAKVTAELVRGVNKPISAEQRARLQIGPDEPIKYRRVHLVCGGHILSEADNWYVPSRLTAEMNRLLETTDTPFGKAVAALHFTRETFSAQTIWLPLGAGWETRPRPAEHPEEELPIPRVLFEHKALLFDENHRPFSEVDERYTRESLVFGHSK